MSPRSILRAVCLFLVAAAACAQVACSASRVTVPGGIKGRYGSAAYRSAADWRTWAPLVAAAAFSAAGWDESVSDSIAGSTTISDIQAANPGFSRAQAERASEELNGRDTAARLSDVTTGLAIASGLLSPLAQRGYTGSDGRPLVASRGKRLAVSGGALLGTLGVTQGLKLWAGRTRPSGADDESFPSGHTSLSACGAAFTRYEIQRMRRLSTRTRAVLDGAYTALPLVTGYLRVRAKSHYPSDVLFGWGLGNFIGSFAYESFLLPRGTQPQLSVRRQGDDTVFGLGLTKTF